MDTVDAVENVTGTRHEERVGRDEASEYEQYCVAVLQGDSEAAYHLGWMRFSGREVPANQALAVGWFRLAAKHGDSHSQRILDDLLPNVQPEKDVDCPLREGKPNRATFEAWINVLAPSYGLDANLLLALVEVESRFNPRARSPKNARGLMQLMPATARRFEVDNIWDPFENLRGGIAYLRWLMDHYKDDLDLSLAAYNAGEHVVNRYGGIPPYRETRNYVKTINHIYNRTVQ
ncbi:MAG: transglycosylase SLT domain-containing protein [Gammaproteobacteria bacterium]